MEPFQKNHVPFGDFCLGRFWCMIIPATLDVLVEIAWESHAYFGHFWVDHLTPNSPGSCEVFKFRFLLLGK